MKKIKKVLAVILSLAMVLGMSLTAFTATPSNSDKADLTITGLEKGVTVKLYQIAHAEYGEGAVKGLLKYEWNTGVAFANPDEPTVDEINAVAQNIATLGKLVDTKTLGEGETSYTYNAEAGAYIAILTSADNDTVYNPIILSAAYGKEGAEAGSLSGAEIDAKDNYLYGTTAVAKSTDMTFDKTMEGYTPDKKEDGKDIATATVGQVLTYTLNAKVPTYPKNATNKTFFMSDTMVTGLTFDYASLSVSIEGQNVVKEGNEFKLGEKVIATAAPTPSAENPTGFNLNFTYDNLISDPATGAVYTPVVSYNAVINSTAVVGGDGNNNSADLYYAKEPNSGSTWDTPDDKPDGAEGVDKKHDEEIVYTYQLALHKIDTGDKSALAGARFGIYTDEACTKLIDEVVTNENGYAVSTRVGAGTYYIKELEAPAGYSLNDNVYKAVASWTTATKTVTGTVITKVYTTEKPYEDALPVGWIKDGIFYAENPGEGAEVAYIKSETKESSSVTEVSKNDTIGAGTVTSITLGGEEVESIPNTKLGSLPSTGGIGTTIFTIGGCAIMIIAAALFFASRRRAVK